VRVNVAAGAYGVILDWQTGASSVKGAEAGYVSNNGRVGVSGFKVSRFQGFNVSRFQRFKVSRFQA
jgi:hypothetical protein